MIQVEEFDFYVCEILYKPNVFKKMLFVFKELLWIQ